MNRRAATRARRSTVDKDVFQRQLFFWLAAPVPFVLGLWLLSEILLPGLTT